MMLLKPAVEMLAMNSPKYVTAATCLRIMERTGEEKGKSHKLNPLQGQNSISDLSHDATRASEWNGEDPQSPGENQLGKGMEVEGSD